jgi:hypothetical protein
MNVIATDLSNPVLVNDYILDLRRLLAAALDAERNAEDEIGDLTPVTAIDNSAMHSAANRLQAAREWKEAITAQLTAIDRHLVSPERAADSPLASPAGASRKPGAGFAPR